jgi:nitroreductase
MSSRSWPETSRTICSRSALRDYTCDPVSDAQVEQLLAGMLAAPSASNKQAWSFVAVRELERVKVVRAFSPGIIGTPAPIVVGCVDKQLTSKSNGVVSQDIYQVSRLCAAMAIENP